MNVSAAPTPTNAAASDGMGEKPDEQRRDPQDRDEEAGHEPAPPQSRTRSCVRGLPQGLDRRTRGRLGAPGAPRRRPSRRHPTTSETITVRASSCSEVLGRSMPNAFSRPLSPTAIPMPATIPTAAATSPVTIASTTTDVITCRRLAPIARSSASSRERWATMIVNVLKMMNAPTNRAMNANTSKATRKKPRLSCRAFDCSSATVVAVTASTPLGSTSAIRPRRSADDTRRRPVPRSDRRCPTRSRTCCAVDVWKSVERGARQVVGGAESGDAADRERPRRPLEQDPDQLPDPKVVLRGRAGVHHDLVRPRRGPTPRRSCTAPLAASSSLLRSEAPHPRSPCPWPGRPSARSP